MGPTSLRPTQLCFSWKKKGSCFAARQVNGSRPRMAAFGTHAGRLAWRSRSESKPGDFNYIRNLEKFQMIDNEIEGTLQSVAGKVQGAAGAITGDSVMEAAGKAREIAGNVQAHTGAALDKARLQAAKSPL